MAITISGTNGIVGAGFTVDNSGVSVTAGVGTFSSIQGSGANLTALPAANLTGSLPALSAASLTQIPAANIVGVCTSGLTKTGGFGKVVQFKYAHDTTLVETTSTSYQTYTQLSIDITPTSATNLIFCQLMMNANVYEQSGSDAHGQMAVTDDNGSSYLFENEIRFYDYGGNGGFLIPSNSGGCHVEAAGTTSAKSYKVRYRMVTGDKIVINNYGTGTGKNRSFFSVTEIQP